MWLKLFSFSITKMNLEGLNKKEYLIHPVRVEGTIPFIPGGSKEYCFQKLKKAIYKSGRFLIRPANCSLPYNLTDSTLTLPRELKDIAKARADSSLLLSPIAT